MGHMLKLIVLSDTHGLHEALNLWMWQNTSDEHIIIHCGDVADEQNQTQNFKEAAAFFHWLKQFPAKAKLVVPGNHDIALYHKTYVPDPEWNIKILRHEEYTHEGVKFFGSPYTKTYGSGWAYNINPSKIAKKWAEIPDDTDILITHGPPKMIGDLTPESNKLYAQEGDKSLLNRIKDIKPKYHLYGHFHDDFNHVKNYGIRQIPPLETRFCNAALKNLTTYNLINEPMNLNALV